MRKITAGLVVLLGLTACSGAAGTSTPPASPSGDAESSSATPTLDPLPSAQAELSAHCAIQAATYEYGDEAGLPLLLQDCGTTAEFLGALRQNPEIARSVPQRDFIEEACAGQDALPVCADAIELGVITASGNADLARLEAVAEFCGEKGGIQDQGKSLTVAGTDLTRGGMCVMRTLRAPDYVLEHVKSTRALDGQQTESWDGLDARWTYHPKSGLSVTVVDTLRG